MHYLYSTKYNGWVSRSANYTSDLTDAATFDYSEATRRARVAKSGSSFGLIPVSVEVMESL